LWDNFENLDTRVILQRLQQPHSVWAWFVGDWVLGNGFYRPLSSVLYQVDYWLWGGDLLRWKWTNGLLATASAFALVGFSVYAHAAAVDCANGGAGVSRCGRRASRRRCHSGWASGY
jgi:hypothetical protein